MDKKTGVVKWFNSAKGFGFIVHEGNDYFVHFDKIMMDGYKHLVAGQQVSFKEEKTAKGFSAFDVEPEAT